LEFWTWNRDPYGQYPTRNTITLTPYQPTRPKVLPVLDIPSTSALISMALLQHPTVGAVGKNGPIPCIRPDGTVRRTLSCIPRRSCLNVANLRQSQEIGRLSIRCLVWARGEDQPELTSECRNTFLKPTATLLKLILPRCCPLHALDCASRTRSILQSCKHRDYDLAPIELHVAGRNWTRTTSSLWMFESAHKMESIEAQDPPTRAGPYSHYSSKQPVARIPIQDNVNPFPPPPAGHAPPRLNIHHHPTIPDLPTNDIIRRFPHIHLFQASLALAHLKRLDLTLWTALS
jgi:hypothetical protein